VIVAHHLIEGLLPAVVAGATSGSLLLVAVRARLGGTGRRRRSIRTRRSARMSRT
jgi:hypothetical protein